MSANTKIEWAHDTFNPWRGCTKVSPGCDHCYAETLCKRFGDGDLRQGQRRRTSDYYWRQPLKWNRKAAASRQPRRVFCASLADVFDNQVDPAWREDLWALIAATPHLTWMLLTKRPQNIVKMLPADWGAGWSNVWLGTTVENQTEADRRIPHLLAAPAAVRFLSCEPLLAPVDLTAINIRAWTGDATPAADEPDWRFNALSGEHWFRGDDGYSYGGDGPSLGTIDWVIVGGESGPGAWPMHPDWARSLRDQCAAAGVPFLFKQWGGWGPLDASPPRVPHALADDGTLYRMADLAFEGGARHGEAIRANHNRAHLTTTYRIGKRAAGRILDGKLHDGFPA